MKLDPSEVDLLEDCRDDWNGLWEVAWAKPDAPIGERAAFVTRLVEAGLLDVLRIKDWNEVRSASPLIADDALATVGDEANYNPPGDSGAPFHVLIATTKAEEAIAQSQA